MTLKRNYRLLCPIARALDVIGDRWTLLILRDLHAGPARFQELQQGLHLATNLLSSRLSSLVDSGLVQKVGADRTSPYALTALGQQTDQVLWDLAQFGAGLERNADPHPPGNARVIALPLQMMLRSVSDRPNLVIGLQVDGDYLTIGSTPTDVAVVHGPPGDVPDLVVQTQYLPLLDLGEGQLALEDFVANHMKILHGAEHAPTFMHLMSQAISLAVGGTGD